VANLGRGPDGRWSALDGRRLYAHARAASFVYQAVLRSELTRTLGLEWLPVRKGIAELVGVPKPVLRAFSRRRAEIEAALEARGTSSPRAAEAAALATRRAKRDGIGAAELVAGWQDRAAELGWGRGDLERLLGRVQTVEIDALSRERMFDALAAPSGLTRDASTFTRRNVIQALCERTPAGARVDARALEAAADRFLASARAVPLLPHGNPEAFRRRDGRLLPFQSEELVYSTPELLALEQRLIDHLAGSSGAGVGVAGDRAVGEAVSARPTLSGEQRTTVERLCVDGDGVSAVVGKAGTGKTFALGAAREAWQSAGLPVLGIAVARRAARELEQDAGIASTSVAALLGAIHTRGPTALPERCVLVVDEAGMVPTRQLAELVDATAAVRGKLVLVGDHRQLPELEAGGAFRGLLQRGLAIALTENRRQVHPWERAALDHLRDGRAEPALAMYQAHDRVSVEDSPERLRKRLVDDWWAAGDPSRAVMLAHRRADVAGLNAEAREHMRAAGRLGDRELRLPSGPVAVGDHVIVKRNDLRLGLVNGERGVVSALDLDARRLTLGLQRRVGHARRELSRRSHRPRGPDGPARLRDDGPHGAGPDRRSRFRARWARFEPRARLYGAEPRAPEQSRLYAARDPDIARAEFAPSDGQRLDPIAQLRIQLGTSSANTLAIDTGRGEADIRDRLVEAQACTRRRVRASPGGRRLARPLAAAWAPRDRTASPRRDSRCAATRRPPPRGPRATPRRAAVRHRARTRRPFRDHETPPRRAALATRAGSWPRSRPCVGAVDERVEHQQRHRRSPARPHES
jgi:AAA domain/TrwC relaxase